MFTFFPSSWTTKQTTDLVQEPEENKTLAIYQRHQENSSWLAQGLNFITAQFPESWKFKPLSSATPLFSNSKRLDATNFANACQILGVTEEEAKDPELVHTRYENMINSLQQRQSKLSGPLASQMQILINDVQAAYKTLTQNSIGE